MNSDKDFVQNSPENNPTRNQVVGEGTTSIPVIEEQLQISKKVVETGGARIHKKVHTDDVLAEVPLIQENVEVERVAVNEYVDKAPPAIRYEGDTTIIPVLREVLVKRLVLVEEVRITKRKQKTQHTEEAVLRTEEVTIEKVDPTADRPSSRPENPSQPRSSQPNSSSSPKR